MPKAKAKEIDLMDFFPAAPRCGRCGGEKTKPTDYTVRCDDSWACQSCLKPEEMVWIPKDKGKKNADHVEER